MGEGGSLARRQARWCPWKVLCVPRHRRGRRAGGHDGAPALPPGAASGGGVV